MRVQLFSSPQQTHAMRIKIEPSENFKLERSSNKRSAQDATTKTIPSHNLALILSLNIINAISAVATISKLLRSEAFAAVV